MVERSVLNVVDGYDASTELPSGNVDIRQSIFLKYRDEDVRIASYVDWPHKIPSPKELAKHGFFHTPLPDVSDRVACCACGKILFNWTEADNIEEGHRKFSPDCPIILGIPLQLPSSVIKAPAPNLAFFVSNLQNGQQCEDDLLLANLSPSAVGAGSHKDVTQMTVLDAESSAAGASSSLWQFASVDDGHNCDITKDTSALATSLKRKKSAKKNGIGSKTGGVVGAHMEDAAAKAVEPADIGLPLDQANLGTEVDSNSNASSAAALIYKLEHILPVEAISRLQDGIQASFTSSLRLVSSRVDSLWQRLSSLNAKVENVQRGQWIRDISKQAADAASTREQSKAASLELISISAQLEEKRASLEALGSELARRELAQREAIEIEAAVVEHRQQLSDLIRKQDCLQLSFASLNAQYESMDVEVATRRDELRLQISALVEEKCSLEVALSLHHERLEAQVHRVLFLPLKLLLHNLVHTHFFLPFLNRQRTELQSFTARVDRCRSKEVAAAQKEVDLVKREEEVRRRELTVNAREDWMQKKEGEFRSAQRVAEHARYHLTLTLPNFLISSHHLAVTEPLLHSQDHNLTHHLPLSHFLMVICTL